MRSKLLRGIAAATVAVTLGVGGTVTPARAQARVQAQASAESGDDYQAQAFDWTSFVVAVAQAALSGGGGGGGDLEAAIQQIIGAVEQSRTEILDHIDAIAAAEVQACARHHTIELGDIDQMPPTVLRLWAQDATACATLASAFFNSVQSLASADRIGFLVPEIYAIAMAARAEAGLSVNLLLGDLIRTHEAIVARLAPTCRYFFRQLSPTVPVAEKIYECVAYNGDLAQDSELWLGPDRLGPPINPTAVENTATRNTSRPLSQDALPKLRQVPL
ncbi:hypothetical protein ACN27G_24285 [Plantactinospora sp. WMMB334]|uniref:hypothetical protein n=1 Tax=Plantactinospora sp. WMMB334 TaxID=3404119 RepID=UPI003B927D3A